MGTLIYIAIIVIDVIVIMDIFKSSKDGTKKILWTLAIIFLPLLGPVLWYVIGKK